MSQNYAKMCFCDGEYLKLTFSIAVFVAWYMRLVFLCIFWYVLAYWRGIDWWFFNVYVKAY